MSSNSYMCMNVYESYKEVGNFTFEDLKRTNLVFKNEIELPYKKYYIEGVVSMLIFPNDTFEKFLKSSVVLSTIKEKFLFGEMNTRLSVEISSIPGMNYITKRTKLSYIFDTILKFQEKLYPNIERVLEFFRNDEYIKEILKTEYSSDKSYFLGANQYGLLVILDYIFRGKLNFLEYCILNRSIQVVYGAFKMDIPDEISYKIRNSPKFLLDDSEIEMVREKISNFTLENIENANREYYIYLDSIKDRVSKKYKLPKNCIDYKYFDSKNDKLNHIRSL